MNLKFSHIHLVQDIMGQISDEFAKKLASHSVPAVMAAEPILPLPNERPIDQQPFIYHSPQKSEYSGLYSPTFSKGQHQLSLNP